jgi:hypothetical protein
MITVATSQKHLFEELGEVVNKGDLGQQDRRNQPYNWVIDLPMRIAAAKKLVEILKTLIGLEREAFGIDGRPQWTTLPIPVSPSILSRPMAETRMLP